MERIFGKSFGAGDMDYGRRIECLFRFMGAKDDRMVDFLSEGLSLRGFAYLRFRFENSLAFFLFRHGNKEP